ncbi:MAG: hypothetical protein LBO69_07480 [Ignavibacteria bacterium]|jgi:hypothetical protein|nr:hypothetical protein [Ignavibacteria bacterium]
MKKILLIVATIFATTLTASAQFSGGSGTQTDPYQITSKADMLTLRDSTNYGVPYWSQGKYFKLMNDITDSLNWTGIGFSADSNCFYGVFDGNNHTIYLNSDTSGIFIWNYGIIENVITAGRCEQTPICGVNGLQAIPGFTGIIRNCHNTANVTTSGTFIGAAGIVLDNSGEVYNCSNVGTITDEYTNGAGGIASISVQGAITNCVNYGLIRCQTMVGGIVAFGGGTISKCINTNAVEGVTNVGAIIGINGGCTITDCFYDIQMCKYKAVDNQDHPGVTGLPTHLLMDELAK